MAPAGRWEQAIVLGPGHVLIGRARVVHDVVVEELQVAGPELHRAGQLLAQRGVQIERLVLRRAHPRHVRQLLRGLHERPRVLRRELPGVLGEDGQRVDLPLAAGLLALAAAPVVGAQERVEIGPPRADRLGHAHRADDLAQPARAGGAHAEQAHHVAAVGVEAQRPARARLAARRAPEDGVDRRPLADLAVARDLVAHLADQLAPRVLVADVAEVRPDAPVEALQLVGGVPLDGEAAQQHDAAPGLQLVEHRLEVAAERRQREVLTAEIGPRTTAAAQPGERGLALRDRRGGEGPDPVRRRGQVGAEPRGRRRRGAHHATAAAFLKSSSVKL